MKRRSIILAFIFATVATAAFPQSRKSYPVPEKTPQVQRLLDSRSVWHSAAADELPAWVDNSTSKYFPAVFNQIGGSCAQSSGIRYMFTYEMNRLFGQGSHCSG